MTDGWHETLGEMLTRKGIELARILKGLVIYGILFMGVMGAFYAGGALLFREGNPGARVLGALAIMAGTLGIWYISNRYLSWKADRIAEKTAAMHREARDD